MNKLILIFALLFFCAQPLLAQKIVAFSDIELKKNRDVVPITNVESNKLSLFISDKKNIYLKNYNQKFELINETTFPRPKSKLKNIIEGVNSSENEYIFLLNNEISKKFGLLKINSSEKTVNIIENLAVNYDQYILTFKYRNQIYVATIEKDTSKLFIHKLENDGSMQSIEYDLSDEIFYNKKNKEVSLYEALLHKVNALDPGKLKIDYIEASIPNSLEKTSSPAKLFISKNKAHIVLDKGQKLSQIITLSLDSSIAEVDNFKKVELSNDNGIKSNSFISKGNLYQLIASKERMKFMITDISSKELIKEIQLTQNDPINFKNTPIIQEGGSYTNYREMEKTRKFLRKITSANVSVSVYHRNDSTEITLGGIKEYIALSSPGLTGFNFPGLNLVYETPFFSAYKSYESSKSTYIKCLFDNDFKHIQGEVQKNAFDKIKGLRDQIFDENTETIFRFNNQLIYGYHYPKHHKYYLRTYEY
ncbi:hypothetical protein M0D21_19425 [Aquimarina sp. D1M17]|uniref:hypothetical protein n=1 Tax=Aquimarina acroporae TaxID=2937283 RepID=UPI0020C178B7|nr:hypothetical protein [Aquimarina acroporae]MCK8523762.1 hypothetical protein [Aquimarina acroporae]